MPILANCCDCFKLFFIFEKLFAILDHGCMMFLATGDMV